MEPLNSSLYCACFRTYPFHFAVPLAGSKGASEQGKAQSQKAAIGAISRDWPGVPNSYPAGYTVKLRGLDHIL